MEFEGWWYVSSSAVKLGRLKLGNDLVTKRHHSISHRRETHFCLFSPQQVKEARTHFIQSFDICTAHHILTRLRHWANESSSSSKTKCQVFSFIRISISFHAYATTQLNAHPLKPRRENHTRYPIQNATCIKRTTVSGKLR